MSRRYDTVIFDLDGTLLNTLEDLADGVNAALKHFGRPERTLDEVRQFVGNGVLNLMDRAVPEGKEAKDFQAIYEWFKAYYAAHSEVKTRAYDGIPELLKQLQAEHFKMAIVSNKFHDAVCQLSRCYSESCFRYLLVRMRLPGSGRNLRRTLFLQPWSVWVPPLNMLCTSEILRLDAATARNAGMDCILVSWGFRERELLASYDPVAIADQPSDIWEILNR